MESWMDGKVRSLMIAKGAKARHEKFTYGQFNHPAIHLGPAGLGLVMMMMMMMMSPVATWITGKAAVASLLRSVGWKVEALFTNMMRRRMIKMRRMRRAMTRRMMMIMMMMMVVMMMIVMTMTRTVLIIIKIG